MSEEKKNESGFADIIRELERLGFEVLEIKRNFETIADTIDIKIRRK